MGSVGTIFRGGEKGVIQQEIEGFSENICAIEISCEIRWNNKCFLARIYVSNIARNTKTKSVVRQKGLKPTNHSWCCERWAFTTPYLEDHPGTCKWLITMVSCCPLRIGLWDPFQMAKIHGLYMGVILTTYRDAPSSPTFYVHSTERSHITDTSQHWLESSLIFPQSPFGQRFVIISWRVHHLVPNSHFKKMDAAVPGQVFWQIYG